ncbi:MAG: ribonuclease III [Clostridia bacterium]|nr:ribonuclease III [Clostridia bacterium]
MQNNEYPRSSAELEEKIKYSFKNKRLLKRALTHSSYMNEVRSRGGDANCNERLEFLGDAVLQFLTSEYIFAEFPDNREGDLTCIRADSVCEKALYGYAETVSLGEYLYLGRGEEKNGRFRKSTVADAFEALIAAIYLDGGMDEARRFVMPFIESDVNALLERGSIVDYKSRLQQIVQSERGETLSYTIIRESGPDHDKTFECSAMLNSNPIGSGVGKSKREAEQLAAKDALRLFGEEA